MKEQHRNCVKQRAARSVQVIGAVSNHVAEKAVEDVFDRYLLQSVFGACCFLSFDFHHCSIIITSTFIFVFYGAYHSISTKHKFLRTLNI